METPHNDAPAPEKDEEEIEAEVLGYPDDAPTIGERRRAFVLAHMANAEIEGRILVDNLQLIYEWLTDGTVPARTEKQKKAAQLKTV